MMRRLIVFSFFTLLPVSFFPVSIHAGTIQLPQSGQTKCYDVAGAEITCTGTGQDGEKRVGVASPDPRFTDNGNGTVTDNLTGLIWLKNADCFGKQSLQNALSSANNLASGQCDLSDGSVAGNWRLPNISELQSLVDYQNSDPAIPATHPFSTVQNYYYWSSDTDVNSIKFAWFVKMSDGSSFTYGKWNIFHVWPVRNAL